jgi:protein-L-isoaspartate(D-aspartate) O-methyltransferase
MSLPEGVEDHRGFQRRFWIIQRCAWVVFALILVACLVGLLGRGGPFSRNVVQLAEGSLDLPGISRWNAPDELKATFSASPQDRIVIVDPAFLQAFSIEGIDPPQKSTLARDGRIGYVFPGDPTTSTKVVFRLHSQQPGLRSYTVGIGADLSEQSTFIFP